MSQCSSGQCSSEPVGQWAVNQCYSRSSELADGG